MLTPQELQYLGSSGGRQSVCNSHTAKDIADFSYESFCGIFIIGAFLPLSDVSWSSFYFWFVAIGALMSLLTIATQSLIRKQKYNELNDGYKQVSMNSAVEVKEEQELYQRLEELFTSSSSDIENDLEDITAKSYLNQQIVQLLNEIPEINSRDNFTNWVEKRIEVFSLITDYIDRYWNSIPEDKHIVLIRMGFILHGTTRGIRYVEELDKDLYSFYQGIVFSFLYKLSEKLKEDNPEDSLWAFKDEEGNFVREFPSSAEKKAIDRLKSIDDESQWISLPLEEKEITDEEIENYMKKRGLS